LKYIIYKNLYLNYINYIYIYIKKRMQNTNLNHGTSYKYRKYKGNFLTPFLEAKTVIIVYVHGFLGSKGTFHEFPELIKEAMKLYNVEVINEVNNKNYCFMNKNSYIILYKRIIYK